MRGGPVGARIVGDSQGDLRIVHWNAACLALSVSADALDALLATDADAILVTDQCWMLAKGGAERVRARGYEVVQAGKFTAFTRIPVREARPLLASRGRAIGRFVFVTPTGDLVVDAVDLPSETTLPRAQLMRTLAAELAAAEPTKPDLYIGDFNITRGSASLLSLAPDHRDAFLVAGRGWGGSYPRTAPFWAIDLALVRAPWSSAEYGVIDLGTGRHRAQAVTLRRD
jgi:endonuclease/exonuclease/phosphatase family metal-dependent hydrolase